jgi:lycopene beta-cyclase
MTYLQFHLLFILPPLAALLFAVRRAPQVLGRRAWWTLPVMALIAFAYTTPWDNYLVYRGIWWYGEDRVMGTIGYVPIEEYMFFVLQPLLTGAWTYWLLMRRATLEETEAQRQRRERPPQQGLTLSLGATRAVGAGTYLLLAAAGALALTFERGVYMGLILAWAAPVLAGQWVFAGPAVVRAPATFALAVGVPTLYLWVADWVAIDAGIWAISAQHTTGLHLFGLPMEEALFFLVTNLLVVQGVLLFLKPQLVRLPAGEPTPAPTS